MLEELGLKDKFIVSCVGNMGRAQAIELMFDATTLLEGRRDRIHFLFIGSGAKRGWMEEEVDDREPQEYHPSWISAPGRIRSIS